MGQSRLHGAGESNGSACNRVGECSSGGVGRKKHRQVRVPNEGQGKKYNKVQVQTVRMHVGAPFLAFSLACHKNRLQIFLFPER